MPTKFTLQVEVILDEKQAAMAVDVARFVYASSGASTLVDDKEQPISPKQFISCTEQALMEFVEDNPLLEQAGIVIDAVSRGAENAVPHQMDEPEIPGEDQFDEEETGFYICRCPTGTSLS
jgi:hypothetical protein